MFGDDLAHGSVCIRSLYSAVVVRAVAARLVHLLADQLERDGRVDPATK